MLVRSLKGLGNPLIHTLFSMQGATGSWDQRHLMDRGKFWNQPLMGSVVDCGLIDGLIVDRLMALRAVESVPGGYV